MFKKAELVSLATSQHLLNLIETFVKEEVSREETLSCQSLRQVLAVVNEMLKSLIEMKVRNMYDNLSMGFVKIGVYSTLVKSVVQLPLENLNKSHVARFLELCACHAEGIEVLQKHLEPVVALC